MKPKATVLVIDEEAYLLRNFLPVVASAGYIVQGTARIDEGTRLVRQLKPDLILLNTIPPDGQGRALCQQVKADPACAGTRIIAFASASGAEDQTPMPAEADEYVQKPISSRDLLARMQLLLRLKKTEQQLAEACQELRHKQKTLRIMQKELHALRQQPRTIPPALAEAIPPTQPAREEWYQALPIGWCALDSFGMIANLNQQAADYLGTTASQGIETFFPDYLVEDDVATFFEHLAAVFETGTHQTYELRILSLQKTSRYLLVESFLIASQTDEDKRCALLLTDITTYQRRKGRAEKRHQEPKPPPDTQFEIFPLQAILEVVQEGITVTDVAGRFVIFNAQMGKLTGYTKEEANRCKNFLKLIYPAPEQYQRVIASLQEALLNGRSCNLETRICARNGAAKTLLLSSYKLHLVNQDWILSTYWECRS